MILRLILTDIIILMLNVNPEDAIRAIIDADYAESLAVFLQPAVVANLFDWADQKGVEHNESDSGVIRCPDCGTFSMHTARLRDIFAESDEFYCISVPCIKKAVIEMGHYYAMQAFLDRL